MTSKRNAVLTYTFLSLALIGSAVFLAYQIRHFMYEREDVLAGVEQRVVPSEIVEENYQKEMTQEKQAMTLAFSQSQSFSPLATPIPTPTPQPTALPTATPVVAAKSWKLLNCLGTKYANMQDYTGAKHMVKTGDVVNNRPGNQNMDFKILEISFNPSWIKVQDVPSGQTRIISEEPRARAPQRK